MNAVEYKRAFLLAQDADVDLSDESLDIFDGYGLRDFDPVVATVRQVARLMRYQALQFNGDWVNEELTQIKEIFRKKVTMVG